MLNQSEPLPGRWVALCLCFVTGVVLFIAYVGYSTQVTVIMENFGLNYTQIGTLASITAITGGITVLTSGNYVDTHGPKIGVVAGLFIAGIGQVIFTFAPNYWSLFTARALMGIGIGLMFLAPYTLVTRWFKRSNRVAGALGVMAATEGIGTIVAVYLLAKVFSGAGYQVGNIVASVAIIGMGLIVLIFLKEPPHLQGGKLPALEEGVFRQYLKVLSHRNIIATTFMVIGLWGAYSMIVFWVPTLLMEEAEWSAEGAGFIAALYPLVGVISAVVSGLLSDKLRNRKTLLIFSGLGLILSSTGFALALVTQNYTLLAILLPVAGLFHYAAFPVAFALASDSVGIHLTGTANGLLFGIGFILGGLVFPLVVGTIRDATGSYYAGFIALAAAVFLLNFLIPLVAMKDTTLAKADDAPKESVGSQ